MYKKLNCKIEKIEKKIKLKNRKKIGNKKIELKN